MILEFVGRRNGGQSMREKDKDAGNEIVRTTISFSKNLSDWVNKFGKNPSDAIKNIMEDYQLAMLKEGIAVSGVSQKFDAYRLEMWKFVRVFLRNNNSERHWDGFERMENKMDQFYDTLEDFTPADAIDDIRKIEALKNLLGVIGEWLDYIGYWKNRPILKNNALYDLFFEGDEEGDVKLDLVLDDIQCVSDAHGDYYCNQLMVGGEYFDFTELEYSTNFKDADRIEIKMTRERVDEIHAYRGEQYVDYVFIPLSEKRTYKAVKKELEAELGIVSLEQSDWDEVKEQGSTDRTWILRKK